MKKALIIFSTLLIAFSATVIGMASAYAKPSEIQQSEIIIVKDIGELRNNFNLSDATEKRECFKELLICAGTSEKFAEIAAQIASDDLVDGIVNAEEIGGASKTFK